VHILITGGSGFIGSHPAETYARHGHQVTVLDNLSRAKLLGKPERDSHFIWDQLDALPNVTRVMGSVLDHPLVEELMRRAEAVVHAAAQTAVTTSVTDPASDFETNAVGTFRILEAARATGCRIPVVLTSTNKVYGQRESYPD
jgi:CDP-paratose 2-epimerase